MMPASTILLLKSLDGLSLRATAIAQNVANANSPGYTPVRVRFEDALKQAAMRDVQSISQVSPILETVPDVVNSGGLRLDLELAAASMTAGRYGAIADLLNRQLQLEAIAVSGGR